MPTINSRSVSLLDHPCLVTQFCGLERRTARGGKDSIDHGPNGHDDVANAVAGTLLKARGKRATTRLLFVEAPNLGTLISSDRMQIEQRTGLAFRAATPELTCGGCIAFEHATERCEARNLLTKASMIACDFFTIRIIAPV